MLTKTRATVDDLYNVPEDGKAELINGELKRMSPTGAIPGKAATRISSSLNSHEEAFGGGTAFADNVGFLAHLPHRESFSPDAAWYVGEVNSMKFLPDAPAFAVEVRSEGDYGEAAERAIEAKIADYFAAGTRVVWDVDLLSEDVITKYRHDAPDTPIVFRRGEMADAEPAVSGWRFEVDRLFAVSPGRVGPQP